MHAALEPLRGRISVLRVYATGADFPAPYLMALVVVERRWWRPWNRNAMLVGLATDERVTPAVRSAINEALWRAGFRRAIWVRWKDGVRREVSVPVHAVRAGMTE